MANTYETGCIQNVANFETLISYLTAFGPDYNPSKNSLTIPELQKILSEAKASLNTVYVAFAAHSNAIGAREAAFEPLSKLVTRANNALKVWFATCVSFGYHVVFSLKRYYPVLQGLWYLFWFIS